MQYLGLKDSWEMVTYGLPFPPHPSRRREREFTQCKEEEVLTAFALRVNSPGILTAVSKIAHVWTNTSFLIGTIVTVEPTPPRNI